MAYDGRKVLVTCVARHHFIQLQERQGRDHGAAFPPCPGVFPIESFNQKNVLARRALEPDGSGRDADFCRKAHGDKFRLHDIVEVVLR